MNLQTGTATKNKDGNEKYKGEEDEKTDEKEDEEKDEDRMMELVKVM